MKKKILFNKVHPSKNYNELISALLNDYDLIREKYFTQKCLNLLSKEYYPDSNLFLTHSATGALEIVAILLNIKPDDEIIIPSFTYVATATPFALRGARFKFIDINPDTLNIDENLIENAISDKTRAVVCMHYNGYPCNLQKLRDITRKYQIPLIEDAAMGFGVKYGERYLGSVGDFGVISFDVTKQISSIQGGLLLINSQDSNLIKRAENIYNIGTNRKSFNEGNVPYFEWVDLGSKFQMPELGAVILFEHLKDAQKILQYRNQIIDHYFKKLFELSEKYKFCLLSSDKLEQCFLHFYLIFEDKYSRDWMMNFLKERGVECFFHYIPLHTSHFGKKQGRFISKGDVDYTQMISETLLRLPVHEGVFKEDVDYIAELIDWGFRKLNKIRC